MTQTTCLPAQAGTRFIAIRADLLALCNNDVIAAGLLSVAIGWTDTMIRMSQHEHRTSYASLADAPPDDLWFYHSYTQWHRDAFMMWSKNTIIKKLDWLVAQDFVQRRTPENMGRGKAYEYRANLPLLHKLLYQQVVGSNGGGIPNLVRLLYQNWYPNKYNIINNDLDAAQGAAPPADNPQKRTRKTPQQRAAEDAHKAHKAALRDTVARAWGIDPDVVPATNLITCAQVAKWLAGEKVRNVPPPDPVVMPDEFNSFVQWWQREQDGITFPRSVEKLAPWLYQFRSANNTTPSQPAPTVPDMAALLDHDDWTDDND